MKLTYLSDIIGTGEGDSDEFRPAIADHPVSWHWGSIVPDDPSKVKWAMVDVTGGDLSSLVGDARIDAMPTCSLDTLAPNIPAAQMNSMRAAVLRRNIPWQEPVSTDTYGEILGFIARHANDANTFPTRAKLEL